MIVTVNSGYPRFFGYNPADVWFVVYRPGGAVYYVNTNLTIDDYPDETYPTEDHLLKRPDDYRRQLREADWLAMALYYGCTKHAAQQAQRDVQRGVLRDSLNH